MALAVKGDEVLALCKSANDQLAAQDMTAAIKTAEEAIVLAEKSGSKSAKGNAFLTLATVKAYDPEMSKDAMDAAKKAKSAFADAYDTTGEGTALAVIGNIHKENINTFEGGSDQQKEAFQGAFRNSKEAVRLMKIEGGAPKEALAIASLNVAMTSCIAQRPKDGLNLAKEAVDLYEDLGDDMGACTAMCYLAELHVWAGHNEDWKRVSMYLDMAHGHTAAAGYWAEKAKALADRIGFQEGSDRMSYVLSMERVQKDAGMRSTPFDYTAWMDMWTAA